MGKFASHILFSTSRLLFPLALVLTCSVLAQSSGGEFEISGYTIDAGGGTSTGSTFELTGTIAQPDASVGPSTGGEFVLAGGFWARAADLLFSDGFEED